MVDINKKQLQRLRYLNQLFDEVGGDTGPNVGSLVVGRSIGLTDHEVDVIIRYLSDEGLIEITTMGDDDGPTVELTHQGLVEIERARTNPQLRTEHFPPMVNIINIKNMNGSQIQQGSVGSSQSQVNKNADLEISIRNLISKIESSNAASEDQKELARTYADVIISQAKISAESRNSDLVKKTWEKLNKLSVALSLIDFTAKAAPVIASTFGFL
ncbi:hypothetical protein [Bdellovibrio bacteriovorus]|uniref:hypothetical protein n=1 Tax=Bdellovibrio bacteriovorus TaxID=959 RepID=UPI00059F343A|nr:hypothetical protein [Bdellovibrio bacteriovorus]